MSASSIENTLEAIAVTIGVYGKEKDNFSDLRNQFSASVQSMVSLLDEAAAPTNDPLEFYKRQAIQFQWAEKAKHLAILYRDLWFSLYKLKLTEPGKLVGYKNKTHALLVFASSSVTAELGTIGRSEVANGHLLEKWEHFDSPVSVYKAQLEQVGGQIGHIYDMRAVLDDLDRDLTVYKIEVNNIINNYETVFQNCLSIVRKCQIPDWASLDGKQAFDFAGHRDTILECERQIRNSITFDALPNLYFAGNEEIRSVPVGIDNGSLIVKQIDFHHQINYWMDAEVSPTLSEIHNLSNTTQQQTYLSLVNAEVQLIYDEGGEGVLTNEIVREVRNSLKTLMAFVQKQHDAMSVKGRQIIGLVEENLQLSCVFDTGSLFLTEESQLQLDAYSKSTQKLISRIPFYKLRDAYNNILDRYIIYQDKDNDTSSLLKFIDRLIVPKNQLNSIYLKKGYIGDSYYVDRVRNSDRCRNTINLWKQGYQGALLVYGSYLSGKTTTMGAVMRNYYNDAIMLTAGASIEFKGDKFVVDHDLQKSIQLLTRRLDKDKRLMLLIDDLATWQDEECNLYDNVQSLLRAIRASRNVFFVVGVNAWLKAQLDSLLGFSQAFSQLINTDVMERGEIHDAILKRYLAGNYLMGKDDAEAEDTQFLERKLLQCSKRCNFNVGAGMRHWHLYLLTRNELIFHPVPRSFKKLIAVNSVLIAHLLKFRSTSEAVLGRKLGSYSIRSLQGQINTLLGYKIIVRKVTGELALNEQLIFWIEKTYIEVSQK